MTVYSQPLYQRIRGRRSTSLSRDESWQNSRRPCSSVILSAFCRSSAVLFLHRSSPSDISFSSSPKSTVYFVILIVILNLNAQTATYARQLHGWFERTSIRLLGHFVFFLVRFDPAQAEGKKGKMPPRVYSKTYKVPRRPFEKDRLDHELKLCGEFGLRNKREVRGTLDEKIWSDFQRPAREKAKREKEGKVDGAGAGTGTGGACDAQCRSRPIWKARWHHRRHAGWAAGARWLPFFLAFLAFLFSLHWWR